VRRRRFLATVARAGLGTAALQVLPATLRTALAAAAGPPHLIERNERPKHWETTLAALDGSFFTPTEDFFLRSHLGEGGRLDLRHSSMRVEGMVRQPISLSLEAISRMPRHEIACTLECAGNGRGLYRLANTSGTQWEYGAVGTARWNGVRIADVLERVGADPKATDLWLRGADWLGIGTLPAFERSIPMEKARADALLAFEMNGAPLPFFHGGPVRLIVPGWYGMAWIKWPETMRVENRPCDGHFMARSYHWQYPGEDPAKAAPVERVRVKSLVTSHADGASVPRAPLTAGGWAWSGEGEVTRVDVSTDGLVSWHAAQLGESRGPFAWRRWQFPVRPATAGPLTIAVRATDASHAVQPLAARPNAAGYGNNSIHRVTLHVS
jgi:sulfite oxidase